MGSSFDYVIIGGGIFGVYSALYLAKAGQKVAILEKENEILTKASIVNQARLHSGYHYPRSVATAMMSDDNKERFTQNHKDFINFEFEKYYAIDKFGSFTDSHQFERFCEFVEIHCKTLTTHPYIHFRRIEALYETKEYTFDPILIAQYYKEQLKSSSNITLIKNAQLTEVEAINNSWLLHYAMVSGAKAQPIRATQVVNATYASSNSINALFGVSPLKLMHEISEMSFLHIPQIKGLGLTVMDGPFGSIMPYGLSGLHSLSSVAYTHHKVSYESIPKFDCMDLRTDCQPNFIANCNTCEFQPNSNYRKMLSQIKQYFKDDIQFHYFKSMYTIKSKLQANYIDDGRPTEISILNENPRFYCIFAGKINSIYEVEKVLEF